MAVNDPRGKSLPALLQYEYVDSHHGECAGLAELVGLIEIFILRR